MHLCCSQNTITYYSFLLPFFHLLFLLLTSGVLGFGKCICNRLLQQTGVNLQKLHYMPIYTIVKYIYSKVYILFISSSFKPRSFGLLAQLNISEIYPGNTLKEIPLA